MQWQADVGPVPQHIAGLLELGPTVLTATELANRLTDRLADVESLARYPVKPTFGGGGPMWLADAGEVGDHVRVERLSDVTDEGSLSRATVLMSQQFRSGRAPWAAYVMSDDDGAPIAVLVVLHHVLADVLAGVELVSALTRPEAARPESTSTGEAGAAPRGPRLPVGLPAWTALAGDAWAGRMRALLRAPSVARSLGPAVRELGLGRGTLAPRSPLNRRTGPSRRHAAVDLPEASVRAAARVAGGSLNDAVLAVIAEVLASEAARLGQELDPVVVSVPVAVRQRHSGGRVESNAVGVRPTPVPTPVPTHGSLTDRIAAVADWRHERLTSSGDRAGASLPLVLASFRVLHTLGLVRWFTDRQRLVTTFATAIPGPAEPAS